MNIGNSKGRFLILAAGSLNEKLIDYILNDDKLDSKKSDILIAFVECYSNQKAIDVMKMKHEEEIENEYLKKNNEKHQQDQ